MKQESTKPTIQETGDGYPLCYLDRHSIARLEWQKGQLLGVECDSGNKCLTLRAKPPEEQKGVITKLQMAGEYPYCYLRKLFVKMLGWNKGQSVSIEYNFKDKQLIIRAGG